MRASRYEDPSNWKYPSPEAPGLHLVASPENSALLCASVYRLNLRRGDAHILRIPDLELNVCLIEGCIQLLVGPDRHKLVRLDSFYLPVGQTVEIIAENDSFLFIGGAPSYGIGSFFIRRFDPELELGAVRQIHGKPPYERNVFMTLDQDTAASRLICGITWGHPGAWTSWPPHQHSKDLEEVYCYFDIPRPSFALHLCSRRPGIIEAAHPVATGDCVVVPEGYHPTVGCPGTRSCYFWVMAAHSIRSRRYDLAVNDFGL